MNAILLTTLLSLVQTNGTVAPAFQRKTVCNINSAQVTIDITGPTVDFPHGMLKKTKYNEEVRNEAVLRSLIMDVAAQGAPIPHPMPIGGAMTRYSAYEPGTQNSLSLMILEGSSVYLKNPSTSAQKLVRFINLNCK